MAVRGGLNVRILRTVMSRAKGRAWLNNGTEEVKKIPLPVLRP